jgi:DNA primase
MPSSGMLCHVVLVRIDVSEERRLLQEPHGITSQETAFFKVTVEENLKSYTISDLPVHIIRFPLGVKSSSVFGAKCMFTYNHNYKKMKLL